MKNSVTPKLLFYGFMFVAIILAMILDSCYQGPAIIVEVPGEAIGPITTNYVVQGIRDDNTIILRNQAPGDTMLMEIENPYDQAYETGLLITLIK